MKKKGPRDIPDFSRQTKAAGSHPDAKLAKQRVDARPPVKPMVKPQSTSAKSGQRGQ